MTGWDCRTFEELSSSIRITWISCLLAPHDAHTSRKNSSFAARVDIVVAGAANRYSIEPLIKQGCKGTESLTDAVTDLNLPSFCAAHALFPKKKNATEEFGNSWQALQKKPITACLPGDTVELWNICPMVYMQRLRRHRLHRMPSRLMKDTSFADKMDKVLAGDSMNTDQSSASG
jgi:hypothetical protein